ncbi:MAG TPA: alpha/beta hydrolase [Rhodanobacteraceae bacterium]|nr:alpha/beta hydrolase [Rhodanobacteraceae bacterium]
MACVVPSMAESTQVRFRRPDGVALAVDAFGRDGAPIVFAHGFGQTRQAWTATAAKLAGLGHRAITFDARGHGDSDWRGAAPYTWEQMRDDLVALARAQATRPVLVGASMGGLVGLAAEGAYAPLFRALVLVDVTPRWEPRGVDRILTFMRQHPHGFESLDAAAAAIAAYLPHRAGRKSPDRLRGLLADHGDGRLRWHWDPRLIDELARGSESYQPLLLEAARSIRVPTLLISGGASDVVSHDTIEEFLALVPHARHVRVAGATHMIVGDDNAAFTQHVTEFLDGVGAKEFPQ